MIPILGNYSAKGGLVYANPIAETLRGLLFDSSRYDRKEFSVHVFVQPLFVPSENLNLDFGFRLSNFDWNLEDPSIFDKLKLEVRNHALPFLLKVNSLLDVALYISSLNRPDNIVFLEVEAACWSRLENLTTSKSLWARILDRYDATSPWQSRLADRVRTLEEAFSRSSETGQSLLDEWTKESRHNLKLPD